MKAKIAPSLMCMDFLHVQQQIEVMNKYADYLHVDLMDLHFVENMGLCPSFVKAIRPIADIPIECHVMGWKNEWWVRELVNAGVDRIILHIESLKKEGMHCLQEIRNQNCKVGLAISPETDIEAMEEYLPLIDLVTVMTVRPGFPGAPFIWEMVDKIRQLSILRRSLNLALEIEMDGSCADSNFQQLLEAGTDTFVVGTAALFGRDPDLERAFFEMERCFRETQYRR